jgi:cyclic pyranopterin phosphate synthase
MSKKLSHLDENGMPTMVDVSEKEASHREAEAMAEVNLGTSIMRELKENDFSTSKGAVFQTAIIAGNMAVKKTSDLIPLCHPLSITGCDIKIHPIDDERLQVTCRVKSRDRTGVEMEALTGASVAALTIYDMVKAMSHAITISQIKLISKRGGKSDFTS